MTARHLVFWRRRLTVLAISLTFLAIAGIDALAFQPEGIGQSNDKAHQAAGAPADLAGSQWVLECVDCPNQFGWMTSRRLQLDAAGHPHVAYGGQYLSYARHDGAAWIIETVDNSAEWVVTPPWPWTGMAALTSATTMRPTVT